MNFSTTLFDKLLCLKTMLFTYFTPLFWFCLFLFIFNLLLRFYLPLDFEVKVFCYYLTRPKLQRALSIMKWFICIYCLVSCVYRIYSNLFFFILLHSPCTILPLDPSSSGVSSGRTEKSNFWKNFTCCFTPTQDESHSVSPPEPTKIPKWVLDVDLPKEHPSDTINDLREKCATIIKSFCQNNKREDDTFVDVAQRLVVKGQERRAELGSTREDWKRLLEELQHPGESDVYARVLKALEKHRR